METKRNLHRLYYLLTDSIAKKTLMQIDEVEMKDLVRGVNVYLNEQKHQIADVMNLDHDFSTWELIRAGNFERLPDILQEHESDAWGADVGMRCLSIMARFYPLMIANLDQGNYRCLVVALILSNQRGSGRNLNLMVEAADLKDGNSESMAFIASQICYLGVNDVFFCEWIVKNWAVCEKHKKEIFKNLEKVAKRQGAQDVLYLLLCTSKRQKILRLLGL